MIHLFFVVSSLLLRKPIYKIKAYFTMISESCVPNKRRMKYKGVCSGVASQPRAHVQKKLYGPPNDMGSNSITC